jgi:hypothetical protein
MQWLRTKIFATAALTMVCAAWLRLAYGAGPVSTSQSATSAACNAVQGDWSWFTGYVVSLKANHTILYDDRPAGTWECINFLAEQRSTEVEQRIHRLDQCFQ